MVAHAHPIFEAKSPADKTWTYDDLEALRDSGRGVRDGQIVPLEETCLIEIYDGELIEMPSPKILHQMIVLRLAILLQAWADKNGGKVYLSPTDFLMRNGRIAIPDLSFVRAERLDSERIEREDGQCLIAPPDLIIEVLSPGTARHDRLRKTHLYAQAGVARYWLIDPDAQSFEALFLEGARFAIEATAAIEDQTVAAPGFADLIIDLEALFTT
jgi:Uma2 family endonuclease